MILFFGLPSQNKATLQQKPQRLVDTTIYGKETRSRLDLTYRRELLAASDSPSGRQPTDRRDSASQRGARRNRRRLSETKARAVADAFPGALIIGGDQVAVMDGRVFSKPAPTPGRSNNWNNGSARPSISTPDFVYNAATGHARCGGLDPGHLPGAFRREIENPSPANNRTTAPARPNRKDSASPSLPPLRGSDQRPRRPPADRPLRHAAGRSVDIPATRAASSLSLSPRPSAPQAVLPQPVPGSFAAAASLRCRRRQDGAGLPKAAGVATPLRELEIRELNEHTKRDQLDALSPAARRPRRRPHIGKPAVRPWPTWRRSGGPGPAARHRSCPDRPLVAAARPHGLRTQRPALRLPRLPAGQGGRTAKELRDLEAESRKRRQTQIFIETPTVTGSFTTPCSRPVSPPPGLPSPPT